MSCAVNVPDHSALKDWGKIDWRAHRRKRRENGQTDRVRAEQDHQTTTDDLARLHGRDDKQDDDDLWKSMT